MNEILNNIATTSNFLKTSDGRRLFENFMSLSILQVANYILPLVTFPYLVRVLGPEKYGLIAFAQAFIGYFVILIDYGFNLSATREVSIYRGDREKISEIFSSVTIIKFALMILSFVIFIILVFSFDKFRNDWRLYFLTFGSILGNVLFPVWLFQGMERMKYITFLNLLSKIIFTGAIFIFIRKSSDYLYVPGINLLGALISGILALWIIFKNFKIKFILPSLEGIKHQLKEGWYIFISTVAISLYTVSNTFILGLFTNNTIVGYYSAGERIVKAVLGLLGPVSQTIYPYISKVANESREKGINFIRYISKIIGSLGFIMSLFLFIFANFIVNLLLGNSYIESVKVLRILSLLPFIVGLSNVFGIQTMLTLNYKKAFSNILISAGILNTILVLLLCPSLKHIGSSLSFLITELFVTSFMFIYLSKKGIKIFWS